MKYSLHTGVMSEPYSEGVRAFLKFILVWSPVILFGLLVGMLLGFEWVAAHIMWLVGTK